MLVVDGFQGKKRKNRHLGTSEPNQQGGEDDNYVARPENSGNRKEGTCWKKIIRLDRVDSVADRMTKW